MRDYTFPKKDNGEEYMLPAKKVYHRCYGSHDGGYDPHNQRWQYWKMCYGFMDWKPISALRTARACEALGFTPCRKCFK